MLYRALAYLVILLALPCPYQAKSTSCPEPHSYTGHVSFRYNGGTEKIYARTGYRILGDLKKGTPMIVLHGGPGATSRYLEPFFELYTKKTGRPVVLYDQIGSGNSTRFPHKRLDEAFWTVEMFVAELDNLILKLGIGGEYSLYGHSWGAQLAAKHAYLSRPNGLNKLILASGPAKMVDWETSVNGLLDTLPADVQSAIRDNEDKGTLGNTQYHEALMVFYQKFFCRLAPWPEALLDSFGALEQDDTSYVTMQGPSEISSSGSLRNFDMTKECKEISVPTLVIYGEYDEAQKVAVAPWLKGIPNVQEAFIKDTSHTGMLEQPEEYFQRIMDFIDDTCKSCLGELYIDDL